MDFLKARPECKPKETIRHPMEKTIKPMFYDRLKYVHNSVNNPLYPMNPKQLKKKPTPPDQMMTISIIGDNLHKDFVESVVIAKHFFKYKSKRFNYPIIRGVSDVEWPSVLRELNAQYGVEVLCLPGPVVVLVNSRLLGGRSHLLRFLEKRFQFHLAMNSRQLQMEQFVNYVKAAGRPFAYMHISIASEMAGVLIFKLYSDVVPRTCENFLRLCAARRGGYAGTPLHRVVADCWVQGGGFHLKDVGLECENFAVPHDRRGVLCMANDGRDIDCSTQFFVLLQPAPWMAERYVAFGQLIRGEETLKKIESVPTYYESPLKNIIIEKAGVLNMDCHGIIVSRETNEYLQKHIENLAALGQVLFEDLMERVDLELEFREVTRLAAGAEDQGDADLPAPPLTKSVHATKRFIRNKHDIKPEVESLNEVFMDDSSDAVSSYLEEEEEAPAPPADEVVLPEVPFYLPLTDVLYPDEVDSTFDLKRFLRGDYCLESDLGPSDGARVQQLQLRQAMLTEPYDTPPVCSCVNSIDSDDNIEIRNYITDFADQACFAGNQIAAIASRKHKYKSEGPAAMHRFKQISDEELRQIRHEEDRDRKEKTEPVAQPIKERRNINTLREDLLKAHNKFQTDDFKPNSTADGMGSADDLAFSIGAVRKVRIVAEANEPSAIRDRPLPRRPTGFVNIDLDDLERNEPRQSMLTRLYDVVAPMAEDDYCPTLKNYRPFETRDKNTSFLTATHKEPKADMPMKPGSSDEVADKATAIQHTKAFARKNSSSYLLTPGKGDTSLRSLEYARTRPTLSVSDFHKRNEDILPQVPKKYLLNVAKLRLPGDTPLHSIAVPSISASTIGTPNSGEYERSPYKIGSANYKDDHVLSLISNMLKKKIADGSLPQPGLRLPGDTPLYSYSEH